MDDETAPSRKHDASRLLFVGTHGWVSAVDKYTGGTRWQTSLPGTGWSIVTLLFEDGVLYAASQGHVFSINPANGEIFWGNSLPKLGNSPCCLATTKSSANVGADPVPQAVTVEEQQRRASHSSTT